MSKGHRDRGAEIYERFEVDFQLDGHYWLQYGLYLASIGLLDEALDMLKRSTQAFPKFDFAVHAYADLQLRSAWRRTGYDSVTQRLIGEAVEKLKIQDARSDLQMDEYPIVTLAIGHVGALVKHNQPEAAKSAATQYFDRLQQVEKRITAKSVSVAKEQMLKYVVLGEWDDRPWDKLNRNLRVCPGTLCRIA